VNDIIHHSGARSRNEGNEPKIVFRFGNGNHADTVHLAPDTFAWMTWPHTVRFR
jgi:hypothetical protein